MPSSPILNGNSVDYNGKNGTCKVIHDYVKPKSPIKNSSGIVSHDNIPLVSNGKNANRLTTSSGYTPTGTPVKNSNGVKVNRNISWNRDIPPEKLSFTMRREFDKAKEESDLIDQLRSVSIYLLYILHQNHLIHYYTLHFIEFPLFLPTAY